jgi:hypothetical protein
MFVFSATWDGDVPVGLVPSCNNDETTGQHINENLQLTTNDDNDGNDEKKSVEGKPALKSGYIEMKCTKSKVFYHDKNALYALSWWAQMWMAKIDMLLLACKSNQEGLVKQVELMSLRQLTTRFLSKYDLRIKYCLSYLHSFLALIERTVLIDDPNTVHAFAYIPQPLEVDPTTGATIAMDLPEFVPFRYTQMKRTTTRHAKFMPQWYLQHIQRTQLDDLLPSKTVEQETKKRLSHRGRDSCPLKQQKKLRHPNKRKS